ncbi:MAG: hypothetical protein AMJ84_06510 [Acidithiobacillales bacterium SM23_46]|nr:MAG: hypothetical protein AMJ84_06510 [Acidithiobacillales bacterium SM23_46]
MPQNFKFDLPMSLIDDVAIIHISGILTKLPGIWQIIYGGTATSLIGEAVREAGSDKAIRAILLKIDSPGGSADGLAEVADALWEVRGRMPLYAQVVGMAASAAYYLASPAKRIYAQRMDLVGSIGTRLMLYDWSRFFANAGVEAVPIDTGPYKSAGALGTEVTAEQRQYFQGIVDAFFDDFVSQVARGRSMTPDAVRTVADGRIYPANTAFSLGLIDGLQSFETTLAEVQAASRSRTVKQSKELTMAKVESENSPAQDAPIQMSVETGCRPATLDELKKALPKADAAFREVCLSAGDTVETAQARWIEVLQERAEASQAHNSPPGIDTPGIARYRDRPASASAATDEFNAAVRERMRTDGIGRHDAIMRVARGDPDLHRAYIEATNPQSRKVQELIAARFGDY